MAGNALEDVESFVAEFWPDPSVKLDAETRLFRDLGITGHDAYDFFLEFQKRFRVDLSDLNLDRHFFPERAGCAIALLPYYLFVELFFRRQHEEKLRLIPITLADLARSVEAGRWVGHEAKN